MKFKIPLLSRDHKPNGKIKHTMFENSHEIRISGGEVYYGKIVDRPTTGSVFKLLTIHDYLTDDDIQLNPSFIVSMKKILVTKVEFKTDHNESGYVSYLYKHKVESEIEVCPFEGKNFNMSLYYASYYANTLQLKLIHTNEYYELTKSITSLIPDHE